MSACDDHRPRRSDNGLSPLTWSYLGTAFGALVEALGEFETEDARLRREGCHGQANPDSRTYLISDDLPPNSSPTVASSLRISAVRLALWLLPIAIIMAALGANDMFSHIAVFFSKMAMVTFGGLLRSITRFGPAR